MIINNLCKINHFNQDFEEKIVLNLHFNSLRCTNFWIRYAQDKNFTHDHDLEGNKLIKCHCTPLNHKISTLVEVKSEPDRILCFIQFDITRTGT